MTDSTEVLVRHDEDARCFEAVIDGDVAGFAEYRMRDGRFVFHHTVVEEAFGGRGVASTLIRAALAEVESRGGLVVPLCPFVAGYIEKHPEFEWLVDPEMTQRLLDE